MRRRDPEYCEHALTDRVTTHGGGSTCGSCGQVLVRGDTSNVVPLRRDATPQEKQAAKRTRRGGAGGQRAKVLARLRAEPGCAGQVAADLGLSPNQVATRVGELRAAGKVEWAGALPCGLCEGTGRSLDERCPACRGMGGTGGELETTPLGGKGAVWRIRA